MRACVAWVCGVGVACVACCSKTADRLGLAYFKKFQIVASSEISEDVLYSLNQQGHEIDVFGVGTNLVPSRCFLLYLRRHFMLNPASSSRHVSGDVPEAARVGVCLQAGRAEWREPDQAVGSHRKGMFIAYGVRIARVHPHVWSCVMGR